MLNTDLFISMNIDLVELGGQKLSLNQTYIQPDHINIYIDVFCCAIIFKTEHTPMVQSTAKKRLCLFDYPV